MKKKRKLFKVKPALYFIKFKLKEVKQMAKKKAKKKKK
jgi:hypothetical protein